MKKQIKCTLNNYHEVSRWLDKNLNKEVVKLKLEKLAKEANGRSMDLNLGDIHTVVSGNPELLKIWADIVQGVAQRR